jgi:peptidoglycan/LPS O-acetylase OafA/YrhL
MAAGSRGASTAEAPGAAPPQVSQAGERRLARVESLRAVAALGVCAAHAWGQAYHHGPDTVKHVWGRLIYGGGFGVFFFFALSGYLLFWPFARHYWGEGARIDVKRYAINRLVRIMPLYWTVVIVLLLLQEHGGSWDQWWRFMLLWENFSHKTIGQVDGALWSLVVEVHFYILLPFIAAGLARLAQGSRQHALVLLTAAGAVSLLLWIGKVSTAPHPDKIWYHNFPATFFFFMPGMLLAFVRLRVEERRPTWLSGAIAHSGVWLALSGALWLVVFYDFSYLPVGTVASFLALGACVLPLRESAARRVLDWRPLAAVGVVSYSLYVWHTRVQENLIKWDPFPDTTLGIMAITIPLSIAAAFLSYRVVEHPFLRLRRRWSDASAPIPAEPLPGAAFSDAAPAR